VDAVTEPVARARAGVTLDHDLHGVVGVRLVDASPRDAAVVERQLGLPPVALDRDPDVVVRFVDQVQVKGPLRYIGRADAAFTGDDFLVLRARHKAPARVRLPLADAGGSVEVLCERGANAVPLLVPLVNLAALAKGLLPLHASAFLHRGEGIVAVAWSKGGKTEALLAFGARGATYVGDEWVYVDPDGDRVAGIPEPVRVWDWQLAQLPSAAAAVGGRAGARLRALRVADGALRGLGGAPLALSGPVARLRPLLAAQRFVDVPPRLLFGAAADGWTPFDHLFLLICHDRPEIVVRPADPLEVAARTAFSLRHERLRFEEWYLKFRFAFPDAESPVVERAAELEEALLRRAFAGKPAHLVLHPYRVSLARLHAAMEKWCR
jgi:hypothetical protein